MKDWWQKISIDWPCALSDFLWAMLVVEPARLIDKITRRRVLHVIGLILLLIFFQQVVAMDLIFLFGVDLGLLMEVAAAIFILTARDQFRTVLVIERRSLVLLKTRAMRAYRRGARCSRRITRALLPPSDDEDGLVGALA
jgi:hypothetical protein